MHNILTNINCLINNLDSLLINTVTQLKRKNENIRIVVVTEEALMTFVVGGSHNSHKKSKSILLRNCIAVNHFPKVDKVELKVTSKKRMVFRSKFHHEKLFASLDGVIKRLKS